MNSEEDEHTAFWKASVDRWHLSRIWANRALYRGYYGWMCFQIDAGPDKVRGILLTNISTGTGLPIDVKVRRPGQ